MMKINTSRARTTIPVMVKKRLFAAASSTLTSDFLRGLLTALIFLLAIGRLVFVGDFKYGQYRSPEINGGNF